ncbi:MAG: hypothetical protein Q9169_000327 [Polycauliona sp. 2 TL-2023]
MSKMIGRCHNLRLLFSLLSLIAFTQQVDIIITATGSLLTNNAVALAPNAIAGGNARTVVIATCPNLPPGECCQAPRHFQMLGSSINFSNLQATDIAAVWAQRSIMDRHMTRAIVGGCSGTVTATGYGPGHWLWRATADVLTDWGSRAVGGSYISLPATLPPDPSTSKWLMAEGVLALVWGGGKWFASAAAQELLGRGDTITGGRISARGIRAADRGDVYARPPLNGSFPTRIQIDGIEYSHVGTFMYADRVGDKINLTDWFIR